MGISGDDWFCLGLDSVPYMNWSGKCCSGPKSTCEDTPLDACRSLGLQAIIRKRAEVLVFASTKRVPDSSTKIMEDPVVSQSTFASNFLCISIASFGDKQSKLSS